MLDKALPSQESSKWGSRGIILHTKCNTIHVSWTLKHVIVIIQNYRISAASSSERIIKVNIILFSEIKRPEHNYSLVDRYTFTVMYNIHVPFPVYLEKPDFQGSSLSPPKHSWLEQHWMYPEDYLWGIFPAGIHWLTTFSLHLNTIKIQFSELSNVKFLL